MPFRDKAGGPLSEREESERAGEHRSNMPRAKAKEGGDALLSFRPFVPLCSSSVGGEEEEGEQVYTLPD